MKRFSQVVLVCLLLGLGLRLYHYARDYPMWHDEAALVLNVLAKSYGEIWGPRLHNECGPPLFLCLEKAVVDVLGDSTFALRLAPLLASCASLIGLLWIGRRFLSPAGVVCLVILAACSDRLLFHACEAKPYATDVLIAVVLLAVMYPRPATENETHVTLLGRQLLILALLSPLVLFLAYPSLFVLCGAALVFLRVTWRARSNWLWRRYVLFAVVLGGCAIFLLRGPVRAVQTTGLLNCWEQMFPSWNEPWLVPGKLVVRTLEAFRYAQEPMGHVLAIFATAGGVFLWRSGQRRLVALLVTPLALNAVAWLLGRYPLAATRVGAYLIPAMLLLIAAGIPPVLGYLSQRSRLAVAALVVLMSIPVALAGLRLAMPWKRLDSASPAAYVLQHRQPDEPVVADLWEQAYYFRQLGTLYWPAPLLCPGDETLASFWFLGNHRDCKEAFLPEFMSSPEWYVARKVRYDEITLLHLRRTREWSVVSSE
jgi:hypothetical protein